MTLCQVCKRPENNTYLCTDCTDLLDSMLTELPWLLTELDNRIQRLDSTSIGTIGRKRRPNELNVMHFDAAETARKIRTQLLDWVKTVAQRHTGRQPPALATVTTKQLAHWLHANLDAIQRLNIAGSLYHDINKLVSTSPDGGQLHRAINPHERHFAGPCPTTRSHNNRGEPIECGHILYAETDQTTVECPECGQKINVERNRIKAAADRDLMTTDQIIEALDNIGESVPEPQLHRWIRARRLRPHGWIHQGRIVKHRIRSTDPAVYSLDRARKLRRRHHALTQRKIDA